MASTASAVGLVTSTSSAGKADTILTREFCQTYYASASRDPSFPDCASVASAVTSSLHANSSNLLPTLSLGMEDPSKYVYSFLPESFPL